MFALVTAAWLSTALVGLHTDVQLKANAQVRAGYTRTPFTQGPESAPLANVPVQAQASWVYNLILTPGARLRVGFRDVKLDLSYAPRIFFDIAQISSAAPQVFHALKLNVVGGQPHALLVTGNLNLTVGGLDLGAAGGLAGEFAGTLRPGASVAPAQYTNISGNLKVEHPVGRGVRLSSTELASKLTSPTSGLAGADAAFALQSQTRLETRNELRWTLGAVHSLLAQLGGSYVQFPFNIYPGVTVAVAWEAVFDTLTRAHARLGLLRYWTSPYRGRWDPAHSLVLLEFGVEHTFTDLGMPRLSGTLNFTEGPYYDLVLGALTPRATLNARLDYRLGHRLDLSLQVRDFTRAYPHAGSWLQVPAGQDKNVAMLTLQMKYKVVTWLALQAGAYGLDRQLEPGGAGSVSSLQEVYFFLGATGTFEVN